MEGDRHDQLPGPSVSRFFNLYPLAAVPVQRPVPFHSTTQQSSPTRATEKRRDLRKQPQSTRSHAYVVAMLFTLGTATAGCFYLAQRFPQKPWISQPSISSPSSPISSIARNTAHPPRSSFSTVTAACNTSINTLVERQLLFPEYPPLDALSNSPSLEVEPFSGETLWNGGVDTKLRELEQRLVEMETQVAKASGHVDELGAIATTLLMDGPAMADYASSGSGASIEYSMTSGSIATRPSLWPWTPIVHGPSPDVILQPGLGAGECWAFPRLPSQVGIRLARPVNLTHVTIGSPPLAVLIDRGTAPKEIEVWAKLSGARSYYQRWRSPRSNPRGPWRTQFLGAFTFEPSNSHSSATFTLQAEGTMGTGLVEGLVLVVRSNWGNDESTCLYRVRAHGVL